MRIKKMDIMNIINIATGVFTGLWIALKIIAPYTKTDKDDKLVKIITKLMEHFSIKTKDRKLTINIKK